MVNTWLHIKTHFRRRLAEWIISAGLLIWGTIVLLSPDLFARENFKEMATLAPQTVWGAGAMAVATLRLFFLTINGWWRPSAHLRAIGSFLSFMGWAAILICYLALPFTVPNVATIGTLAALDLTSLWFAAEDAAVADHTAREKREQ